MSLHVCLEGGFGQRAIQSQPLVGRARQNGGRRGETPGGQAASMRPTRRVGRSIAQARAPAVRSPPEQSTRALAAVLGKGAGTVMAG